MKQFKRDNLWHKIDECGNIMGTSVRQFEDIEVIEDPDTPTPGPTDDPPDDF